LPMPNQRPLEQTKHDLFSDTFPTSSALQWHPRFDCVIRVTMSEAGECHGAPGDPAVLDWARVQLPNAWPDRLRFTRPRDLWAFLRRIVGPRVAVELPADLPGRERLPSYLLQEFHHLPNGTYSSLMAAAYADWFDRVMFGVMRKMRRTVARALVGDEPVLDLGCGAGGLAGALRAQGAMDVWGLDACPYLLKCAAQRHPEVRFVQGLAESTGFPAERFAAVGACFLFHELPPEVADAALAEVHRILAPGGRLAIAEPARENLMVRSLRELVRRGGVRALYFAALARTMYEPAVAGWHARDLAAWFPRFGFTVERDETRIPVRFVVARKRG
jgi:ubiquinone/menaquinone biosynthesis C-methylase UbiE